jgi:hypothetical protein
MGLKSPKSSRRGATARIVADVVASAYPLQGLLMLGVLSGCGGGGGGGAPVAAPPVATVPQPAPVSITGTVALGAAAVNYGVSVVCTNGSATATTDATGGFSVSGIGDAPCLVTASSAPGLIPHVSLRGVALSAGPGTIRGNVTPITEAIVQVVEARARQANPAAPPLGADNFRSLQATNAELANPQTYLSAQTVLVQSLASNPGVVGIAVAPGTDFLTTPFRAATASSAGDAVDKVYDTLRTVGAIDATGLASAGNSVLGRETAASLAAQIVYVPVVPTSAPTPAPTQAPTPAPTTAPTTAPTPAPTQAPTAAPTAAPTPAPTAAPTPAPTAAPTSAPTQAPTAAPTAAPTPAPTQAPTSAPTQAPTAAPTPAPTAAPTLAPTPAPTQAPTQAPTAAPTPAPSEPPVSVRLDQTPGTASAPSAFDAAGKQVTYLDDVTIENYATITNFGANDAISFTPAAQGLVAISSHGTDVAITVNKNGIVSNSVLRNVIKSNQIVYDVASFNALAVGDISFNAPETTVGTSLDSAGGTLANPATLDAGNASYVFTDDARQTSNVRISNFGRDDVLTWKNTLASSVAVSTKGSDVSFVVNQGGTVSSVTLLSVVPAGVLVYDVVTFNALGKGSVQFQ